MRAAIQNTSGRDFDKKKRIIAGIYLKKETNKLVGLAEIFEYKKRNNSVTIGYKINELYWHKGIATETIKLLVTYLCDEIGIKLINAFIMKGNKFSERALIKNGFVKDEKLYQGANWGGYSLVELHKYVYKNKEDVSLDTLN